MSNLAQLVGFLLSYKRNCVVLKQVLGLGEVGGERIEGRINELLWKRFMDEKENSEQLF